MNALEHSAAHRPLLIAGRTTNAADLALRRVLRAKAPDQAVAVIDCQGHLATLLTKRNRGNMHKGPVLWCELANRRRPIALFRFRQTTGMKPALRAFLRACSRLLAESVSTATIDAVVDLAFRLADQGSIGLPALLRGLRRPELAQPVRRREGTAGELERLVTLLEWALQFPSVWALSEGNNTIDLSRAMAAGGTVWIEVHGSHFERLEHQLASWMVDAAFMDGLLSIADRTHNGKAQRPPPILLYGFPGTCPLAMADGATGAKLVGVFGFSATHPLPPAARAWLEADADCWIAGSVGDLTAGGSVNWLDEAERNRLRTLEPGQVWVRSGANHKAVTMLVRPPEECESLPQGLRRMAQTRLRLSPIKQFSTALARADAPTPQNADLYAELCTKRALYAGWFRVKSHNRRSFGHDHVTIEQFGDGLDAGLDCLARELAAGRYRSRPLRTVRIPKPDGEERVLRIACVRDRVVQAACLHLIEPLFESRFSSASFAYRPGRGAHHAVALARSAIRGGKHHVVSADIRKCFDTIDHDILLRLVGDVIADRDILQLIRNWLTTDVIDFMEVMPSELGVPQGEAISPLLANIYLDPLDKAFEQAGATFVRYADDYLVLCESEADAQARLRMMGEFLQGVLRLALKPAKTQHGPIAEGVDFLGFRIGLNDVCIPTEKLARTAQAVGKHLEAIASTDTMPTEKWHCAQRMNALIRGFRNYFLIDDAPAIREQLLTLDEQVQALAGDRFTNDSGLDLLWSGRERFLPDSAAATDANASSEVATIAGGYLQDDPAEQAVEPALSQGGQQGAARSRAAMAPDTNTSPARSSTGHHAETDVMVVDGRLHVMTSGCYVTVRGDDLLVRRSKADIFRAPITELTLAYLEGRGIGISADLTMRLCEQDIPVVFTALVGAPSAVAQSVQSLRSNVRQQQVLRRNDPDILKSGLRMLAAKVANQASVLRYFAKYRKRRGDESFGDLSRCADDLRGIAATLDELDPTAAGARATGMGHEGRAAAKYWNSFATFVPGELSFPGRHTRNAADPVNSAINYVYTMLYGEVWRSVIRAGLDPYFGIIHGTERDQGSLVFDLIEEYRAPFGDRLVIGMLGRGFSIELDKEGRLRAACRHKLVSAFHKQWHRAVRWRGKMRPPSEVLEMQVASLKKAFLGDDEYRPFRFQW